MFSRTKNSPVPPTAKNSAVLVVKEPYWRSLIVVRKNNQLYLCQAKEEEAHRPKYEIVYNAAKIFSLCRADDYDAMSNRFDCLRSIINVMFHPTNPHRNTSFIIQAFQKVIDASVAHPNWRDVHISAYNGYVDFFKQANLSAEEINAQQAPDMCTPLQLAILQSFPKTMEAILAFEPNLLLLDSEDNSILHYAANSSDSILERLLNYQLFPDIRDLLRRNKKHWSPVELAAFNLKKDNLRRLILHGLTVRALSLVVEPGNPIDSGRNEFLESLDNDRLISFSKEDLEKVDLTHADQGGCPLHWALGPTVIEKLVCEGFHLDTPNFKGESALSVMVRHDRAKCALSLLCNGADTNKANASGNSPMVMAIKCGNVHLLRTLLVFDGNVNDVNSAGESLRHMAATGTHANHPEMLAMLIALGAQQCEILSDCVSGCVSTSEPIPDSGNYNRFNYHPRHRMLASEILRQSTEPKSDGSGKSNDKTVMMVCFDGGGIKGLFTVQMMIELSKHLKEDFRQYFEWISGTSTGAMIALSLAKGKSLAELRKLYFSFKDSILTGSRPYNEATLETLFRSELGGSLRMGEALREYGKHIIITATRVNRQPPALHLFRSYTYPGLPETDLDVEVWKALRASAAAPTYFKSFSPYIDGGMVANNPTCDALTEYLRYQKALNRHNSRHADQQVAGSQLRLILSFGNGQVRRSKKNELLELYSRLYYLQNLRSVFGFDIRAISTVNDLVTQVKSILTNCNDNVVHRADSWCAALQTVYYRLNPVQCRKMSLNETDDEELIKGLWEVKLYASQNAAELRALAQVLDCLYKGGKTPLAMPLTAASSVTSKEGLS